LNRKSARFTRLRIPGRAEWCRRRRVDGADEAVCPAAHVPGGASEHVPPDPDRACSSHTYADLSAAAEYTLRGRCLPLSRAGAGPVIVDRKDVRARYPRLEAIWLWATAPADLAQLLADLSPQHFGGE